MQQQLFPISNVGTTPARCSCGDQGYQFAEGSFHVAFLARSSSVDMKLEVLTGSWTGTLSYCSASKCGPVVLWVSFGQTTFLLGPVRSRREQASYYLILCVSDDTNEDSTMRECPRSHQDCYFDTASSSRHHNTLSATTGEDDVERPASPWDLQTATVWPTGEFGRNRGCTSLRRWASQCPRACTCSRRQERSDA